MRMGKFAVCVRSGIRRLKCGPICRKDNGSATVSAVAMIVAASMLLVVIAAGCNLFISAARAHTAADAGALAGAQALRSGKLSACGPAGRQVSANNGMLKSCTTDEEDVTVQVSVKTAVPLLPEMNATSRAGPVDCDS